MIRNAKVGERVQALDRDGEPITLGSQTVYGPNREEIGKWDYSLGNTGTIVEISYYRRRRLNKKIVVEPDAPNYGRFVWFPPGQLKRLK